MYSPRSTALFSTYLSNKWKDTNVKFLCTSRIVAFELSFRNSNKIVQKVFKMKLIFWKTDVCHLFPYFTYSLRTTLYFQSMIVHRKEHHKSYCIQYKFPMWLSIYVLKKIYLFGQIDRFSLDFFLWKSGWVICRKPSSGHFSSNTSSVIRDRKKSYWLFHKS